MLDIKYKNKKRESFHRLSLPLLEALALPIQSRTSNAEPHADMKMHDFIHNA